VALKICKGRVVKWIMQPHLIKNLELKFGDGAMGAQQHETPGKSRYSVVRSIDKAKINGTCQSKGSGSRIVKLQG
jgi:hypothetical protein